MELRSEYGFIMQSKCFEDKSRRHKLVHEMRQAGATYKEIEAAVGVKAVTIWKYLQTELPVVPQRLQLSRDRFNEAAKMKAAGATYQQIGEKFGITTQSAAEILKADPYKERVGTCSVCGKENTQVCFHHTDYVKNSYEPVCRSCHMKRIHPEFTKIALDEKLRRYPKQPRHLVGRMGPPPRTLNGKTAKEIAIERGIGIRWAQQLISAELGNRWKWKK